MKHSAALGKKSIKIAIFPQSRKSQVLLSKKTPTFFEISDILTILRDEFYSASLITIPMLDRLQNIVYDTNYTAVIANGGFVVVPKLVINALAQKKEKKADAFGRMDSLLQKIGLAPAPKKP